MKLQRDLLMGSLDDSPSLLGSADQQVVAAYEHAQSSACLQGQHHWPENTPWPTLQSLLDAAELADQHYLVLEQAHDSCFRQLEPIPKEE